MLEPLKEAVQNRLSMDGKISPAAQTELVRKLLTLSPELRPNLAEWACGLPLSEIPVREKYTVNAVLSIRGDNDVLSVLLDLDAYGKDPAQEFRLWRKKL